jgi:hypothetical protein
MKAIRIRAAIVFLAYAYWPLLYFVVYLPLIVPKLAQWKRIPLWIFLASVFGFVALLAGVGATHKTKVNLFHAIGVTVFLHLFLFILRGLSLPGFRNTAGYFDVLTILLPMLIVFVLLESGRILVPKKAR